MRGSAFLSACLVLSVGGQTFAQTVGSPKARGKGAVGFPAVKLTSNAEESAPSPVRTLFVPITPCRVADTSWDEGQLGGPNLGAGETRQIPVLLSPCGIPADAAAYSMNFFVKPDGVLGYLTAWAAGEDLPLAAALNAAGGQMKSSAAIVPAGVGGDISMFSSDTTAAAIDINGYFSPSDPNGLAFYPTPTCILGMFGAYTGYTLNIPVNDPCGAPSNAAAYSINARVWQDDGTLPGSLTIWPEGQQHPDLPTASTSPFEYYVDKSALVPAGWSGGLSVLTTDEIEFWILVHGYFGPPGPGGLFFYPLRPCRLEDTRQREGFQLLEASYFHVDATAKGCGVPDNADALALNVTVLSGGAGTQARLYSSLQSANFWELQTYQGRIANNMGIVQTSGGTFYVNTPGFTHVVIDVSGYFAP